MSPTHPVLYHPRFPSRARREPGRGGELEWFSVKTGQRVETKGSVWVEMSDGTEWEAKVRKVENWGGLIKVGTYQS